MPPDLPATVTVSAPDSASVSSLIDLHCESAPSFPAASLKWRIVDQMEELVKEVDVDVEEQEDGGFVAISDLRWASTIHNIVGSRRKIIGPARGQINSNMQTSQSFGLCLSTTQIEVICQSGWPLIIWTAKRFGKELTCEHASALFGEFPVQRANFPKDHLSAVRPSYLRQQETLKRKHFLAGGRHKIFHTTGNDWAQNLS